MCQALSKVFYKWFSFNCHHKLKASLVTKMVKNLSAEQETKVRSLGQEDPLERGMATHSSILAWRTLWTEEPCELQSMGLQRVRHDWAINTQTKGTNIIVFFHSKENRGSEGQSDLGDVTQQSESRSVLTQTAFSPLDWLYGVGHLLANFLWPSSSFSHHLQGLFLCGALR